MSGEVLDDEPLLPAVAPEYTLAETQQAVDEWLASDDPNPPGDLIEVLVSVSYWLDFLKKSNDEVAKAATVVGAAVCS